jgi:hypothetical protein
MPLTELKFRKKYLTKIFDGDELTQAAKITNRPAADQIAFVQKGKMLKQ